MILTRAYLLFFLSTMILLVGCNKEEDDIPTTIMASDFSITIQEKPTASAVLGKITASSNKPGLSFKIKSQTVSGAFAVNGQSGEITIANADVFVYAQNPTLSAVVVITSEEANKEITVSVTLTEEPIMITADDFTLAINEKRSTGTLLGSIQASTNRGTLSYSIKSQSAEGAFAINESSGSLTVLETDKWFYHINETLTAVITVTSGTVTKDIDVTVQLNDLPPVLTLERLVYAIDENPDPTANWDYQLSATSDEGMEGLEFSIISQTESDAFSINQQTGVISLQNLDLFNYELHTQLNANVAVSQRGTTATANFKIELRDQVLHLNEGLVAYYPFINNIPNDHSGNGHHGTIVGNVAAASNRYGGVNQAIAFNGGSISIPGFGDNQNQFTIAAWVMDNNSSTGYKTILSKGDTNREYVLRVAAASNCDCINLHYATGSNSLSCPTVFPKTTWKHVLFTYDNGTSKLYIDGTEVNSRNMTPINWNNGNIRFGSINSAGSEAFLGRIDEVVFMNRVITQSEIDYLASH